MTPKEKTEELVQKFYITDYMGGYGMVPDCYRESAIGCALITVDEILNVVYGVYDYDAEVLIPYWEEVKQELEKLK